MGETGFSASASSALLSLRQLRSFLVVADEMHFGRAATRLHVSQPALSQQIARLEAIVGTRLLERGRVTLGLTAAGERFRDDAELITEAARRAVEHARHAAAAPVPITVSHALTIEWSLLPALLQAVSEHPALDVVWLVRSGEGMAADLRAGSCDLALARHLNDSDEDVTQEILMREQPAVYVSAEDPLATRQEIRLEEIAGRRVRMFRREVAPKQYDRWAEDLRVAGVAIDASDGYRFGAEVLAEVARGDYVILGQASARGVHDGMAVVPVPRGLAPLPVTLAMRRGEDRPEICAFAQLARALTAADGPLGAVPWRAKAPVGAAGPTAPAVPPARAA
jgi:DNA-binding transcriptional LysR family regulator